MAGLLSAQCFFCLLDAAAREKPLTAQYRGQFALRAMHSLQKDLLRFPAEAGLCPHAQVFVPFMSSASAQAWDCNLARTKQGTGHELNNVQPLVC